MNLKKILITVNIILTCLILWTASTIVMTWMSKERSVKTVEDRNPKQEAKGKKVSGQAELIRDYQTIIQQDIFRTTKQQPKFQAAKVEEKKIEVTSLNLKLKGIVIRSDNRSFVVIMDLGTRKEDIYYLNDMVQNARVVKILRDQVILEVNNRQEALFLFEGSDESEKRGETKQTAARPVLRPAVVPGPPPPDPTKSSLGEDVARRLPAMIRRKRR